MAKVEIEDRCFQEPRLKLAVATFKVTAGAILGQAAILWRFSQQQGVVEASRSEIRAWLDTDRFAKPDRAIQWLEAADFLRARGSDTYEIAGNSIAVQRTAKRVDNARRAAKARYQRDPHCDTHAPSMPDACAEHASRMPDIETGRQGDRETYLTHVPAVAGPARERRLRFEEVDLKAARWMQGRILAVNPKAVQAAKANLEAWANDFRLMREADKLDMHEIAAVAQWALAPGGFWSSVIQSPDKLRKKWDTLTGQIGRDEMAQRRGRAMAWDIPDQRSYAADAPAVIAKEET